MEWIVQKGGLLGRQTKIPERTGENGIATHVILSTEEYDNLQNQIIDLEKEVKKARNSLKATKAEYSKKSNQLTKETEDLRRRINEEAEVKIMEASQRMNEQEELNRNLLRISKERSNTQRGLVPAKKHSGYVVLQSRQIDIRFRRNSKTRVDTVWETTIQTPYGVDFSIEQVERLIDKEVFSGSCKASELGLESINIEDYSKLISVWAESTEEIKNTIFKKSYRLNVKSGFWDVIYLHNKPLSGIPEDMRP